MGWSLPIDLSGVVDEDFECGEWSWDSHVSTNWSDVSEKVAATSRSDESFHEETVVTMGSMCNNAVLKSYCTKSKSCE